MDVLTALNMLCALKGLRKTDRIILALYHYEEMTMEEIASVMNMTKEAVQSRYDLTITRLQEHYDMRRCESA